MKIIKPSHCIESTTTEMCFAEKRIVDAARTCYKSEGLSNYTDDMKLIKRLISSKHDAMLEHFNLTVRFICDRGVSHELVRHRLASFAQESTRYNNYSKDKFDNQLTFIVPSFWEEDSLQYEAWKKAMEVSEHYYMFLINQGSTPQEARSVLPNSLKTEIVVTTNIREWRHILKLRTAKAAHPQIRELMIPLLLELQLYMPILFEDIELED